MAEDQPENLAAHVEAHLQRFAGNPCRLRAHTRLKTIKSWDRQLNLRDVAVGENPYNLLQQVNAALAQSYMPFGAWRLEGDSVVTLRAG